VNSLVSRFCDRSEWLVRRAAPQHRDQPIDVGNGPSSRDAIWAYLKGCCARFNGGFEPKLDLLILCCVRSQRGIRCGSVSFYAAARRENRSFM
jgi:hypothetical protein